MLIRPYVSLGIILWACMCSEMIQAITLPSLYQAIVPVTDKSQEQRELQFQAGLDQVIQKVAANERVLLNPTYLEERQQAEKFISKYTYHEGQDNMQLTMHFNEKMLNDLVSNLSNQFVLRKNRPLTLLWLALESPSKTYILGGNSDLLQVQMIEDIAAKRGLPITFPLLDLVDKNNLEINDIIHMNQGNIKKASQRYQADLIIAGRIKQFAGQWRCQWYLLTAENEKWEHQGEEINVQLDLMFDKLSEYLIDKYAVVNDMTEKKLLELQVTGINDSQKYAKVLGYLNKIPVIKSVQIKSVSADIATFELEIIGEQHVLEDAIKLDKILVKDCSDHYEEDILNYKVRL